MTSDDRRRPIAPHGEPDRRYAHLEPIVEAELSWGNRVDYNWRRLDKLLDDRILTLMEPFHIGLLRRTFLFPPNIRLYAVLPRPGYKHDVGRLLISDTEDFVKIDSPLPEGWTEEGELPW
ncbi:MAG: hypothetical protein JWO79_4321 [Actinomycetia bacterium]|nr:hypothetical protein [Actinomycetes bacterium]